MIRGFRIGFLLFVAISASNVSFASEETLEDFRTKVFTPVSVGCLTGRDGAMEIVSENHTGRREKILVTYRGGKPTYVELFAAEAGEPFEKIFSLGDDGRYDLTHEEQIIVGANLIDASEQFIKNYCSQSSLEARESFLNRWVSEMTKESCNQERDNTEYTAESRNAVCGGN